MSSRPRRNFSSSRASSAPALRMVGPGTVRLARVAQARRRIAAGWYDRADVRDDLVTAMLHEVRDR